MSDKEIQYLPLFTEPNNSCHKRLNSSLPFRDNNYVNLMTLTQGSEEDNDMLSLRKKFNELRKMRLKSQNEVRTMQNKITILHQEETKTTNNIIYKKNKNNEIIKTKTDIKKFRLEVFQSKKEREKNLEMTKRKIIDLKEKIENTIKSKKDFLLEKKHKNAKFIFNEREKIIEEKTATINEFLGFNKFRVEIVKHTIESAKQKKKEEQLQKRINLIKQLEDNIKDEEMKKFQFKQKVVDMEKKEMEIFNRVKVMSPNLHTDNKSNFLFDNI
jgi:hypothetical protein